MDYTATLLVAMHGKDQRHCVGRYVHDIAEGNYVVYKITDPGGVKSTLSIANEDG